MFLLISAPPLLPGDVLSSTEAAGVSGVVLEAGAWTHAQPLLPELRIFSIKLGPQNAVSTASLPYRCI